MHGPSDVDIFHALQLSEESIYCLRLWPSMVPRTEEDTPFPSMTENWSVLWYRRAFSWQLSFQTGHTPSRRCNFPSRGIEHFMPRPAQNLIDNSYLVRCFLLGVLVLLASYRTLPSPNKRGCKGLGECIIIDEILCCHLSPS